MSDLDTYLDFLDEQKTQKIGEARRTLLSVADTNPEREAKAAQLSREFQVPQRAVSNDLEFYEKEKKIQC